MKVLDLINELSQFDPEQEVHFAYRAGDYWRTQVAPKVDAVDAGYIEWSDYHRMPKVSDEEQDQTPVVILS